MKNFYLKLTVSIFMLTISTGLFSQWVIKENSKTNSGSSTKYKSHFDESKYTKVQDENRKKVFVQNKLITQNAPEGENNTENVTLSISLTYDPGEYQADGIMVVVHDESGYQNYGYWEGSDIIDIEVPEGIYDIMVLFMDNLERDHIVIKEEQIIQGSTEVAINVSEAVNFVSVNTLDENGNTLEPGVQNSETGSYSTMFYTRFLNFSPSNETIFGFLYGTDIPFGDSPMWNFYINDVSNRYTVAEIMTGAGYEGNDNYFTKFPTLYGVMETIAVQNNPQDWVFHQEEFHPTPLGASSGTVFPLAHLVSYGSLIWELNFFNLGVEGGFKAYLNNPTGDGASDIFVFPKYIDHSVVIEEEEEEYAFHIKGNAIVKEENAVKYGSGASLTMGNFFLANDYYFNGSTFITSSLFHPKFSFDSTANPDIIQGNNVPISTVGFRETIKSNYVGRYGEVRESDFFATTAEVKQDGATIFSGNYMDNEFWIYSLPETGSFEVTFNNTNIEVDGLAGENITKLFFDKANEDSAPPTLQHLQFRNSNGKVTDRFSTGEEGSVKIAAGDFQYTMIAQWLGYFDYVEGNTVEFFYSPYNQNNWTELELTEHEEYFQMPAFGDYYEASLASVIVPEDNTWFDIRIICADAAGNRQEQVISPAFKIEQATMGVEEMERSGFAVYPNPFTNEVNIQLPEDVKGNYTFKVSDLTGKTIYSQNQSEKTFVWNGSSLPKGVYILSIENNGKVIAKKVIKK